MLRKKFALGRGGGSGRRKSGSSASSSVADPSMDSTNLGGTSTSNGKSSSGKSSGKKILVDGSLVQVQHKIAQGGQAVIYLGRLVDGGAQFAKLSEDDDPRVIVKATAPISKAQLDEAEAELALYKQMRSKHTARYIASDTVYTNDKLGVEHAEVFLVLKYYEGGTLLDHAIKRRAGGDPLAEEEILCLMYQVARAIEHLHLQDPPVAHRDIKLENIVLDGGAKHAFLCDFGSATTVASRCETKQERQAQEDLIMRSTTPLYRAPELCDLYSGKLINEQVDVWALGCALYALGTGEHAFEGGGALAVLSGKLNFPKVHGLSSSFERLVRWILTQDPERRPRIGDVVDAILELCPAAAEAAGERLASAQRSRSFSNGSRVRTGARLPSQDEDLDDQGAALASTFEARAQVSASAKSKSASDAARQRLASRRSRAPQSGASSSTSPPSPPNSSTALSPTAATKEPAPPQQYPDQQPSYQQQTPQQTPLYQQQQMPLYQQQQQDYQQQQELPYHQQQAAPYQQQQELPYHQQSAPYHHQQQQYFAHRSVNPSEPHSGPSAFGTTFDPFGPTPSQPPGALMSGNEYSQNSQYGQGPPEALETGRAETTTLPMQHGNYEQYGQPGHDQQFSYLEQPAQDHQPAQLQAQPQQNAQTFDPFA